MKKRNIYLGLLALTLAFSACEKNQVQIIDTAAGGAKIKFFNFGLNAPSVNFYANTTKMTAVLSATGAEATTGIAYGSVGPGSNYANIAGGTYAFKGQISAATDKDLAISNLNATVENGKSYTVYLSGPYNTTTKTVDSWIIEDVIPEVNSDVTFVKFTNAIYNSVPMDFYVKNTVSGVETKVNSAIAYKSGGQYITLPAGVYDLYTRAVGGTTNLISRAAVSFERSRYNTIAARGDMTVVSTTATNRPFLDNTNNR